MISWGFTLLVVITVVGFALMNQQPVDVSLLPFTAIQALPLYLIILVGLAGGILVGGFIMWAKSLKFRRRARDLEKKLSVLETKIAELSLPINPDTDDEAQTSNLPQTNLKVIDL